MSFSEWREKRRLIRELGKQNVSLLRRLREATTSVIVDTNEPGWLLIHSASQLKELDTSDQETLRNQAIKLFYENPTAHAVIRSLVKFVIGRGIQVEFPATDDEKSKNRRAELDAMWAAFCRVNDFEIRQREILTRSFRDGECFIQLSSPEAVDYIAPDASGKIQNYTFKIPRVRFIEPYSIKDPSGKHKDGIEFDPDDAETPVAYYWVPNETATHAELIPAEEVIHVKLNVDMNVRRGRSVLEPVLKPIVGYSNWLESRRILNAIRANMALVKHVKGTPTGVAAVRAAQAEGNSLSGLENRQKMPKPGTTITAGEGVSYEFLTPNVQAADVQHDGRAMLLTIAAGTGLAEYMVSGDASNANYASTMVSESPAVREFEDWQDFFREHFRKIVLRVVDANQEPGAALNDESDPEIIFPPLITRNLKEENEAFALMNTSGVMSKATWAARMGLDFGDEQAAIAMEDDEAAEVNPALFPAGDDTQP